MDLADISNPSFSLSSKLQFTVPSHHRYPSDVYKWMKKNATPRMAIKLMQICKYFCYEKFPYLVTYSLKWIEENAFDYWICLRSVKKRMEEPFCNNLWITGGLTISSRQHQNIFSRFIKYMVVCDANYIRLDGQNILFSDFKILAASGSIDILHCYGGTRICDEEGNIVPMENILECLPKLERLVYDGAVPSFSTSNLSQLKLPPRIDFVLLKISTEPFDFDNFVHYMEMYPKTRFSLEFNEELPLKYTQKLQDFVDKVVKIGLTQFPPPMIAFLDQTKASYRALRNLANKYQGVY